MVEAWKRYIIVGSLIKNPLQITVLLWLLLSFGLHAELDDSPVIAIQGYSPVSYFTKNRAEMGSSEFAVEHENKLYYMTSLHQADLFRRNPEKFIPLFSELCPYSLTLGRRVKIDPTNFKIVGGQLLLFHRSDEMDALKQWNKHDDEQKLLEKANQEFLRFRF